MGTLYNQDVAAWAQEQSQLLRSGRFSELDVEHIADEIDDVGRRQLRELANCMALLLCHLLRWQHPAAQRDHVLRKKLEAQRKEVNHLLNESPSLVTKMADVKWLDMVWSKAVALAVSDIGLDCFPENMPWSVSQVMKPDFYPDD